MTYYDSSVDDCTDVVELKVERLKCRCEHGIVTTKQCEMVEVIMGDMGKDALCQNWFAKFRSGNFDVEDAPLSGRYRSLSWHYFPYSCQVIYSQFGLAISSKRSSSKAYDHRQSSSDKSSADRRCSRFS
ncbi:hypothetical protein TNCV_4445231 [Trichonephila clavipes]|nr:hypothetical protein TNCV_4445231 [Trichonephila clavipes]